MGIYAKMRNWLGSKDLIRIYPLTEEVILSLIARNMKIIQVLYDIFLDKKTQEISLFTPMDLTGHYKKELGDIALDAIYVGVPYKNIETSLHRFKYSSEREYVDIFVDILSKLVEKYDILHNDNCLIVPVPMHWTRYIFR
jgi:hypothetical protein